jgi:hypothetical protein
MRQRPRERIRRNAAKRRHSRQHTFVLSPRRIRAVAIRLARRRTRFRRILIVFTSFKDKSPGKWRICTRVARVKTIKLEKVEPEARIVPSARSGV